MSYEVREFIKNNWDSCIKENTKTDGTLIGMPYPYTVPAVGHFDEMYYWDTYFTNKGLEIEGRYEQARNNTDNMLFLIGKFGYMPNGNRTYYLNRSQPPFLSLMVRDVYEHYNDKEWLKNAYKGLKAEYRFWTSRRGSPVGLSHYDYESSIYDHTGMANGFVHRAGFRPEGIAEYRLGRHFASTAESGWDITPRFGYEGYNCAAVDLNSLLYMLEKNLEFFAEELGNGESEEWGRYAEERKFCMNRYMLNEDGLFVDYNFASTTQSKIFSVASIYPLFAGLATKEQAEAVVKNLDRIEAEYGMLTCEKNDAEGTYQWDYPNGWACLQYITIMGLDKYGYREEAHRIANKYVTLVDKVFAETGNLWEKYNVVEGNINVSNEYKMPAMMGWSAGTYLAALEYLKN